MRRNNVACFTLDDKTRIRNLSESMTLRQLATRYRCSVTKILCALGKWKYPRAEAVNQ